MQFDALFATTTGYTALDQRISMARNKRKSLLLVLDHPFLLLHNNGSELRQLPKAFCNQLIKCCRFGPPLINTHLFVPKI